MAKKIYVGNLSYETDESTLEEIFSEFGAVESVRVITDRDTGRSKGFGFVEMGTDEEGKAAIAGLNQKEIDGRQLIVNEAREKQDRKSGGEGRSYGGGGRDRFKGQKRY
jgi:cold-inducible RNA-binding protein